MSAPKSHTIRYALPGALLPETLEAYRTSAESDPFGTWLLLPTKHIAAEAVRLLTLTGNHPILPDHITTPRDLALHICRETDPDLHLLTPGEQNLLIRSLLAEKSLRSGMRNLFGTTQLTSATITNLRDLITSLEQNRTTLDLITPKTGKISVLAAIHTAYRQTLDQNRLTDQDTAYTIAASALPSPKIPINTLYLYGIINPLANEETFLQNLIDTTPVVSETKTVIPGLSPSPHGESISGTPGKTALAAGLFADAEHQIPKDPETTINVTTYPDTITELSAILDQICHLLETGVRAESILILTPSLNDTIRQIDDLIGDFSIQNDDGSRTPIAYTAAHTRALADYPEISALLSLLTAPAKDYPLPDLIQILTLPELRTTFHLFTSDLLTAAQTLGITRGRNNWSTIADQRRPYLEQKIAGDQTRSTKKYQIELENFETLQTGLVALINAISPASGKKQSVRSLCTDYLTLLTKYNLLGNLHQQPPGNQQLRLNKYHSILTSLAASPLSKTISLTPAEFADTISSLCISTPSPLPSCMQKYTITIAGIREAVHTRADHIFIPGLTRNTIPRIKPAFPCLTIKETAAVRKTTIDTLLLTEKHYFAAACLAADKTLTLSCAGHDASRSLTPSPFLARFPESVRTSAPSHLPHSQTCCQKTAGQALREGTLNDQSALFGLPPLRVAAERAAPPASLILGDCPDLAEQFAAAYHDQNTFAPTTLETYASCPFIWYLQHHLRLTPPPTPASKEHMTLGVCIHAGMERFLTAWTEPITPENESDALALLTTIMTEELSRPHITTPKWEATRTLYLDRRLPAIINKEKSRGGVTSRLLEEPFPDTTEIPLPDAAPLRISGRPDRIDFSSENTFTISDYKTGSISSNKYKETSMISGISLQLPLYVAAVETAHPGMNGSAEFYCINKWSVSSQSFSPEKLDEIIPQVLEHCKTYRLGMQAGICTPNPESQDCKYCPWKPACRIAAGGEEK